MTTKKGTVHAHARVRFHALRAGLAGIVLVALTVTGLPVLPPSLFGISPAAAGPSTASIGDLVWNDLNGDGIKDVTETGKSGVTVSLLGAGRDGVFGTNDDKTFTPRTTNAAGAYTFTSLAAATYRVTVTVPTGWSVTTTNPLVVALADAQVHTAADFGLRQTNASIGDLAWRDSDEDGTFDTGEPGFSGVAVTLKEAGTVRATTTTAADGAYSFTGLPSGSYTVEATTPANYVGTTPTGVAVTLAAGQNHTAADFGFREADASIGDTVFEDDNGNGALDAGEVGRAGVVLTLTKSGQTVGVATTDNAGMYTFGGLRSGSYTVTVTVPVDYALTTAGSRPVTLGVAQAHTAADFGVRQSNSSIGDFVFEDTNGNGTLDVGESGKAGVILTLRSGATTVATTTSNASGNYTFSNLPAGSYTVTAEALPALPTTASPFAVTLGKGESYVGADFGMVYLPASTVTMSPAAVSTVAGNGANATVDGTGAAASFREMGGVTVVGGFGYVGTWGSVRKVNPATGAVTTLAGSPTATGCTDSTDPTAVRFGAIADVTTDGTYLYAVDGCASPSRVRRIDLATGATTTVGSLSGARRITLGPDGRLYLTTGQNLTVVRMDRATGATTTFASFPGAYQALGIAADASALWVAVDYSVSGWSYKLQRVDLGSAAVSTVATSTVRGDDFGSYGLASAGDHLYVTSGNGNLVKRVAKDNGATAPVAGVTGAGYVDATGTDAWFDALRGIVSDGTALWVADGGNHRLRKLVPATSLPSSQPSSATTTVSVSPGTTTTRAGNGTAATVDGTGSAASFADTGGMAVVGGFGYVATTNAVRKVNLATGAVSTLAGRAGAYGCADSTDPTAVRFGGTGGMATDGYYLYTIDGCTTPELIRRTSIATGATSTLGSLSRASGIAMGPDGFLYVSTGENITVVRMDRFTGTATTFASFPGAYRADGIAADASALWVGANYTWGSRDYRLQRVDLGSGAVSTLASSTADGGDLGLGGIASAGDYLYVTSGAANSVVRVAKSGGSIAPVAGTHPSGYADGTGAGALLSGIRGIASDGSGAVWVADSANHRVRRIVQAKPATAPGGPTPRERLGGSCVCAEHETGGTPKADPVDPSTGNFYESTTDLAVPGRGFSLAFGRSYSSLAAWTDGPLGWGWTHSYAVALVDDPHQGPDVKLVKQENGSEVAFTRSGSAWVPPTRVLATLVDNGDGTWTYTRRGGERFVFDSAGRLIRQVDRNGHTTTLAYDGNGHLATVTDPASRQIVLTWTGNRITRVADFTGRDVTFAYDAAGNLVDVTDVAEGNTHFGYDTGHLLLTVRDPRANTVTTNTFDSARRLLTQADALGKVTTFAYFEDGTVTVTDPTGRVERRVHADGLLLAETHGHGTPQAATWSYDYDPVSLGVVTLTDPNSHVQRRTYDSRGNVLTATDALNRTTTFTYDAFDEPLTVTDARNVTTTMTYDATGNLLTRSTPLTGSSQVRTTTYHHDDPAHPGDVTSVTDPAGKTWSMQYDGVGNVVRATDPLGNATTFGHDGLGRRTSETSPRGNATGGVPAEHTSTSTHNAFGDVLTVTDPLGRQTVRTYDPDRNVATERDPGNHTTTYTYDAANRLRTATRPDTTTLGWDYDDAGRLTTQRDGAGRATTYGYDPLGRVNSSTDPLTRTTSFGFDGAGNRTSVTDPDGRVTTFSHDAEDRLVGIAHSDGVTPNVTMGWDELGRRTSTTDGTGTSTWAWDSLSRLVSHTNGAGATVGYGWDLADRLTSLVYPGGATVTRGHDDAGRLTSVTDWSTRTFGFSWDPDGNLVGRTLPNGTTTTAVFDRAEQLTSVDHRLGGTSFASFSYGRDAEDRVTSATPTGTPQVPEAYTYSTLDRLATLNGANYGHDAADNLTALPDGTTFVHDVANELQSMTVGGQTTAFTHDARGNRTSVAPPSGPATVLGWDQANRLVSFGTAAAYAYDGDGLRASKTVSGVTRNFVWDVSGGLPLLLKDGTDAYVYGPDGTPLERVAADGTATFVHADQLGSVRALTDSTGAVVGTFAFDPYGNPTGSTGTVSLPFGFAGEYRDAESGMVYLRARYYDPATGRFVSVDPAFATTASRYGYVEGDPLNAVDPSGLYPSCDSDEFYDSRYDACLKRDVSPPSFAAPDVSISAPSPTGRGGCTGWLCRWAGILGPPIPPSLEGVGSFAVSQAVGYCIPKLNLPGWLLTGVSGLAYVVLAYENPPPGSSVFSERQDVVANGIPYF